MKFRVLQSAMFILAILTMVSCRKQLVDTVQSVPGPARKVQFALYTDKDFSTYTKHVTFTLSIRNSANQVIWDSILPVMLVKDIPDAAHKLVIEKAVPGNDQSELKLAFDYYLENVGYSWYVDVFKEKEQLKLFEYNFQ